MNIWNCCTPILTALEISARTRLFDLIVLLIITILPLIVRSTYYFVATTPSGAAPVYGQFTHFYNAIIEASYVVLLLYVLRIRGRALRDLGWTRTWNDLFLAIALYFGANVLRAMYYLGLTLLFPHSAIEIMTPKNVESLNSGFSWPLLLLLTINPFMEELIVRGYLQTEIKAISGSAVLAVTASVLLQVSYHLYQGIGPALSLLPLFLMLAIFYNRTGRLTPVVIVHLILDLSLLLHRQHNT